MDTSTLQFIQVTSFAPAILLLVWKVLIPLTNLLIARFNGTDPKTYEKLCKIEGNDLHEIRADITEMKANIEYLRQRFGDLRERVAKLEVK